MKEFQHTGNHIKRNPLMTPWNLEDQKKDSSEGHQPISEPWNFSWILSRAIKGTTNHDVPRGSLQCLAKRDSPPRALRQLKASVTPVLVVVKDRQSPSQGQNHPTIVKGQVHKEYIPKPLFKDNNCHIAHEFLDGS